ncbi:MAG: hypothetical protein EAZ25_22730 [Oscillatoriales cyanobacterium]|nr:MAG: hypothetical protein EAZ88_05395 [Oscillatoriales cyanobacterium]TAE63189.1 MAG: hypothetical protein EAZ86_29405 [Oscillatoriales cyanobacterium]TAG63968.1 MAG: hypothetical protein EAZ25_22730 [Oscillatoriales cyanobacterium]TAH28559.1 MAG: hypothetical protein EAZ10_06270 [Oscillatoriales cyanobacterium]
MTVDSWQLAVGSWQLAVDSWQLIVDSWQLTACPKSAKEGLTVECLGSISVLHLIVRASPLASPGIVASGDARTIIKNAFFKNEMLPLFTDY